LQSQLLHNQKLESMRQLTAGIAHEINTPIQYIGTNITFLEDGFKDVVTLIDAYHRLLRFGPVEQLIHLGHDGHNRSAYARTSRTLVARSCLENGFCMKCRPSAKTPWWAITSAVYPDMKRVLISG